MGAIIQGTVVYGTIMGANGVPLPVFEGSLVDSRRERRDHRRRSSSSGDLIVLDVTTPASTEKHATRSESRRRRRSSSGSSITAKAEGEESEVTYHIGAEPSRAGIDGASIITSRRTIGRLCSFTPTQGWRCPRRGARGAPPPSISHSPPRRAVRRGAGARPPARSACDCGYTRTYVQ